MKLIFTNFPNLILKYAFEENSFFKFLKNAKKF